MAFYPPKLRWLLPAVAAGAMVLSAGAQQAGQPIIFSSPQTGDAQPAASSPTPDNPPPGTLPGMLQAPVPVFNFNQPGDRLPSAAAPGVSLQQRRMQQLLEDRKNWTLMTPEEIFGVTTTEKMLQPPERDALGQEKNPTQLERYLERESQLRTGSTNGWQNDRASSDWNLLPDRDSANPLDAGRDNTAAARSFSQLLNGQPNRDDSVNQNGNSGWDALSQPLPQAATKPDLEQLAAMERFRQMLNPGPVETAQSSPDSRFFPAPKPAVDPFLTRPDFVPNPAGASFMPLNSGIARPTGLTPLPGAVTSFLPAVAAPAWRPQPPPWLLQGPQPFVMPQPKGF